MKLGLERPPLALFLPPEGVELCRHDLAIVLRFVDPFVLPVAPVSAFMRSAVPDAYQVRIPSLEWDAVLQPADGTYRFSVSNASRDVPWQAAVIFGIAKPPRFPVTPVPLTVEVKPLDPSGARYFVPGPIFISLPVPGPFATPQQQLAAYLREVEAFPAPLFRAPTGETYIRGVVRNNVGVPRAGVEVALYDAGTLPISAAFTRTDAAGFFGYRLPSLKRPNPVPAAPSLGITVRPVGGFPFPSIQADPHPTANAARAEFSYGATTSVAIRAQ